MFKELDSLNFEDFINVCHGIYGMWGGHKAIAYRLPSRLKKVVDIFVENHPEQKFKEPLAQYLDKRVEQESPPTPAIIKASREFLDRIAV